MSQVRKYQSGGATLEPESLIKIGNQDYLRSDVVKIFKNKTLRNSYSKDFLGNNDADDALFNRIADIYANGIESGEMNFAEDGIHLIDPSGKYYNTDEIIAKPKTEQDYFNNQSVRVMSMFQEARMQGLLPTWERKLERKTSYQINPKALIAEFQFDSPDASWTDILPAWYALDPIDQTTKMRSFESRRQAYANALRKEAERIETDLDYRKKFKFKGEDKDPQAYKTYVNYIRQFADKIEKATGLTDDLYEPALKAGIDLKGLFSTDPEDVESLFSTATDESVEAYRREQIRLDEQRQAEQNNQNNQTQSSPQPQPAQDVIDQLAKYLDPLATENVQLYDGSAWNTIGDNISSLKNEAALKLAHALQTQYGREQIKSNWYSWDNFAGKWLENLTHYFSIDSGYHVYALTNGPISHKGKRFFVKKPGQKRPTEVKLRRIGVDYYAYDKSGKQICRLGMYSYDYDKVSNKTIQDLEKNLGLIKADILSKDEDTGEPLIFDSESVFSNNGKENMQNFWSALLALNFANYDARRFEDILKKVSMQFLNISDKDIYKYNAFNNSKNPRSWNGTRFALYVNEQGKVVFSWVYGDNELAFISNATKEEFNKKYLKKINGHYYIDYGFISKVVPKKLSKYNQDIIGYKQGGIIGKMSVGGTIFDAYNSQNQNTRQPQQQTIDIPQPVKTNTKTETPPAPIATEEQLEDFTVADGVRLGAAILDLTGAFMLFPKGLNYASAAVSGASLLGYIGADITDIINGKKDLWPTLKHDLEIAGVQAIALVNPVKAGQIAPALAKIVPMVPHIAGILWTYDIIKSKEGRASMMATLNKVSNMEVDKMTSQDLTNLAFMARTLIGAKMGVKSLKTKAKNRGKVKASEQANVNFTVKTPGATEGEVILNTKQIPLRKGSGKEALKTDVESLKKSIVEEYNKNLAEGEAPIKVEDIAEVFDQKGNAVTKGKVSLSFKRTTDVPIDVESWAPSRLFERAIQYGSTKNGTVSRESTWLGRQVRRVLGDDFDVSFSDEAIYRNKQQRRTEALAKNLIGGLNGVRQLGADLERTMNLPKFKEKSSGEQAQIIQDILTEAGYIHAPGKNASFEGAVNKANEIIEVANTIKNMPNTEAAKLVLKVSEDPNVTQWKGDIQPRNTITSEMVREANAIFEQRLRPNQDGSVSLGQWLSSQNKDLQTVVEAFQSNVLNNELSVGSWKPQEAIGRKLQEWTTTVLNQASVSNNPRLRQAKSQYANLTDAASKQQFILNLAKELVLEGRLSKSDYELIKAGHNLMRNYNPERISSETSEPAAEPKPEESLESIRPTSGTPVREPVKSDHDLVGKQLAQKERNLENLLLEYLTPEQINELKGKSPTEVNEYLDNILGPESPENFNIRDIVDQYLRIPEHTTASEEMLAAKQNIKGLPQQLTKARSERIAAGKELKALNEKLDELTQDLEKITKSGSRKAKRTNKEIAQLTESLNKRVEELEEEFHELRNRGAADEEFAENAAAVEEVEKATQAAKDKKLAELNKLRDKYNAVKKQVEEVTAQRTQAAERIEAAKQKVRELNTKYKDELKKIEEIEKSNASDREKRGKYLRRLRQLKDIERHFNSQLTNSDPAVKAFYLETAKKLKLDLKIKMIEKRLSKLNVTRNKFGGHLDFAEQTLNKYISKFQQGGYLPVGEGYTAAVQPNFDNPYTTGWTQYLNTWFSKIGKAQLPGIIEMLRKSPELLGNNGVIYRLNQNKSILDSSWSDDFKKNNGAYLNESVGRYQTEITDFVPVINAIKEAYSSGRYMMHTNNPSSGKFNAGKDDLFSAITHDMTPFGNINWLTQEDKQAYRKLLKSNIGDEFKLVVDKNGYIYPVDKNQETLIDGESWFYTNDNVDVDGLEINSTQNEEGKTQKTGVEDDGSRGGSNGPTDKGVPYEIENPIKSLTPYNVASLANALFWDNKAYNALQFRYAPQVWLPKIARLRRGLEHKYAEQQGGRALTEAKRSYTSDARVDAGIDLNTISAVNDAIAAKHTEDNNVFQTSLDKVKEILDTNALNSANTTNTNLTNYTNALEKMDINKYKKALTIGAEADQFIAAQRTSVDNANKAKLAAYNDMYDNWVEEQYATDIYNLKKSYYDQLPEAKRQTMSMEQYIQSDEFKENTDQYANYLNKLNAIEKRKYANKINIINRIYSPEGGRITVEATKSSIPPGGKVITSKNGGRINMAKGGASINWVKVENARMINKSINSAVQETYRNLRSANRELQKTIRSLDPLIKQLSKREIVKLK